jgi:hypothetical protein
VLENEAEIRAYCEDLFSATAFESLIVLRKSFAYGDKRNKDEAIGRIA